MAYTTNKELPRVRQEAVRLVRRGWSARKVGRHLGYYHTAVMKWVKRAGHYGDHPLPTRSSRPKISPHQIDESIKKRIIDLRIEIKRCTEVIHLMLQQEGIKVCKNTVHRVLGRKFQTKPHSTKMECKNWRLVNRVERLAVFLHPIFGPRHSLASSSTFL